MTKFSKLERIALIAAIMLATFMFCTTNVSAMHISEGFLQPGYCIMWGAICIPFLVLGIIFIKRKVLNNRRIMLVFAMAGAYAFMLSSLKIPSVSGSSSHPTGTGLGAILFGPTPMSVVGVIVLLFQAIFLAHGGLTTIGANAFSMAIAGPFASFGLYKLSRKLGASKVVGIFIATSLGDLVAYCVTSVQLSIAHPADVGGFGVSLVKFLSVFAVTQIPLAIIEGLLSVAIVKALEAYATPEMSELQLDRIG